MSNEATVTQLRKFGLPFDRHCADLIESQDRTIRADASIASQLSKSISANAALVNRIKELEAASEIERWRDEAAKRDAEITVLRNELVKARRALEILDLYFAPWGAAKAARWEALTNDTMFDGEAVCKLIHEQLKPLGHAKP